MKKSLQLFLVAIISIFIADRIVFEALAYFEKDIFTGEGVGKVNLFMKVKDSSDLIIFGSSRAVHHVNPKDFNKSAFNVGLNGTKLGYASALITMLDREQQTILIHIDHFELFDKNYEGNDGLGLLYKSFDNKNLLNFFKHNYYKEFLLSKISKCYVYNGKVLPILRNLFFNKEPKVNSHGYEPLVPNKEQQEIFSNMLQKQKGLFNEDIRKPLQVNPKINTFVDEIIKVAVKNKLKFLFFTSPSLNKVDAEVLERTNAFFKQKGVLYIDYIDFFNEPDITRWQDYKHLSQKGATLFSKELANSCIEIFNLN